MAKLEGSRSVSVVDKPHDCPVAVCANAYDTSALYQSGGKPYMPVRDQGEISDYGLHACRVAQSSTLPPIKSV
ncbi:hypothetical protein PSE10B_56270 [Pseudomonas amygdali pv. eriobotryae]|nr:hypothetical protein PSE10B_56270 [Pseudomonas amygdali pv. eriobotryae]